MARKPNTQDAQQLLDNPAFQQLADDMRGLLFSQWCRSKEVLEREAIHDQVRALDHVIRFIRANAEDMKNADKPRPESRGNFE